MVIFLYGADTFRIARKLKEIVEEYKQRGKGLGFLVLDALMDDTEVFFAGIRQNSLFDEKKFFVIKNPIANKEFKEALIERMDEVAKTSHNIVFCQEGKVLKADRLLGAFKKFAEVKEFTPLEGDKLMVWIIREFALLGKKIGAAAAKMMALKTGSDLWRAENEIQKLGHQITEQEITANDVEQNVRAETETNIFKTIEALAQRDKRQALALVKDHIQKGDHPLYLLTMIAGQFRNLLLAKACDEGDGDLRQLGIHPYVLSKTVQQAKRFKLQELKEAYRRVVEADFKIKTGVVEAGIGLDLFIAELWVDT